MPEQLLRVRRRRGRAQRRHRVFDAVLRQRDDVHVSLDHDHLPGGADRLARLEQPVELAPLGEQRRFRRVQVLGLALVENAAAEADHATAAVVDRKHDAVAKTVVALAAVAGDDQPGGFHRLVRIVGGISASGCQSSAA